MEYNFAFVVFPPTIILLRFNFVVFFCVKGHMIESYTHLKIKFEIHTHTQNKQLSSTIQICYAFVTFQRACAINKVNKTH